MQVNEGSNQGIRINFLPPEQGNLIYKLNNKLRTFQLTLSLSKTWELDQKSYPTVGLGDIGIYCHDISWQKVSQYYYTSKYFIFSA